MKTFLRFYKILYHLCAKQLVLVLLALVFLSFKSTALNYYWIGGSGNWNDLSHWATTSGGSTLHTQIPTALDDVFFDANSFSAAGQTVNLNVLTVFLHSMNWTGSTNTPTLNGSSSNILKIYGSVTFVAGMNMNFMGKTFFEATTTGQTITMGGKSFKEDVTFQGIGGGWTLLDAFVTTKTLNLYNGSLNSNSQTLTATDFSSITTSTRSLDMGSSVFNIALSWKASALGMTLNCGTSVMKFTSNGASLTSDGLVYNDVNFTSAASTSTGSIGTNNCTFHDVVFSANANIGTSNIFHNVTITGDGSLAGGNNYNDLSFSAGHTYTLTAGTTETINGTFSATGTCGAFVNIHTNTSGGQVILNHPAGTVTTSFLILKDVAAGGGGNFIANNSVDLGNNSGWTINSAGPKDLYWINNGGNWNDGSHWSLTSGGAASGCSPTPLDNVFFDANSFSSPTQTVTINVIKAYCKNMNWTGVANSPTINGVTANILEIYGSLTFVAGMNQSFLGEVDFTAATTGQTVTMAGKSFKNNVKFLGIGGGWTLQDLFSSTGPLLLYGGTLNSNDQTVNIPSFFAPGVFPRSLIMGSSVFNLSVGDWSVLQGGSSVNSGTSVINCAGTNVTFMGGGFTYNNVNFTLGTGTGTIYDNNSFHDVSFAWKAYIVESNTFHNVSMVGDGRIDGNNVYNNLSFSPGHTYTLWQNSTQTINGTFTANGTCGAFVDIHSISSGMAATISHPPGTVTTSYLILKDISAGGGGNFIANNSIDLGNNSGWTINNAAPKNLYWINNSGNWEDGSHWSLTSGGAPSGCSPTPSDNVFFDANSFSLNSQNVTISIPTAYCRNMNWTGVTNTPTMKGSVSSLLEIYGSVTFVSGMNLTYPGYIHFEATTPGQTIRMGGKSFVSDVHFNGIGGGWTLQDAFTSSRPVFLNNGTLNTNDQTVTINAFTSISLVTRALNMGSSVFNLTLGDWYVESTGLTLNSGTSVINCAGANVLFRSTGLTYNDVNFTAAIASASISVYSNNNFHDVVFSSNCTIGASNIFHNVSIAGNGTLVATCIYNDLSFSAGHNYALTPGVHTINGRWFIQGSCTSYIGLQTNNAGVPAIVTKPSGQVLGFNIHMKDINCTGGANFIAYNSVDLGGNLSWNFLTLGVLLPPSSIIGPSPVCAGATGVVYHTAPVQGAIFYQWTVPPGATITSGQGDTMIVVNFGTATSGNITVQTFNGCNYSSSVSSFAVTIAAQLIPTVTITSNPSGPICSGTSVTFTATATNTGTSTVTYYFLVNAIPVQTGPSNTYTTSTLANGDWVKCNISITGGGSCFSVNNASSNVIPISVTGASTTPTVSIAANPPGPACSGAPVTFTATASTNGTGTVTYDFKVNGISVQSSPSNIYTTSTLINGDVVTCNILISYGTCYSSTAAVSNSILMSINPSTTASVSITANPSYPMCVGAPITFTATTANTVGGTVSYDFRVNFMSVQNGPSNVFTTSTLIQANIVDCIITLVGGGCHTSSTATSNMIQAILFPVSTASISITASSTSICPGTPVTFTAVANTQGGVAFYQWKINGVSAGTNSPTFVSSSLNNGDVVTCTLWVNTLCVTNPSTVSNSIVMNVFSSPTPVVTITASNNNICANAPVTFTASPSNIGSTPSFQWQLNGINVGSNSVSYFNNSLVNGDKITCIMNTVTTCAAPVVLSNTITMIINPKPVISFSPSNPTIIIGDAVQLNASAAGNITSYLWTPSTGLSSNAIHNPIARPLNTITYHLHVSGGVNCFADSNITVKVLSGIYIPNAFMPGAVNNIFRIPPLTAIKDLQYFQVYNRYGNLIFYTNDINKGWDGTWKGTRCDPGTYTYIIKARDHNGEVLLKGTVNLIR